MTPLSLPAETDVLSSLNNFSLLILVHSSSPPSKKKKTKSKNYCVLFSCRVKTCSIGDCFLCVHGDDCQNGRGSHRRGLLMQLSLRFPAAAEADALFP